MKKLSVPYTIKRRGIYYLNLRWKNTFIRRSLATGNPLEAINLINQIRPHLKEAHGLKDNFIRQIHTVLESARPKICIDNENSELDEVQIKISQAFVVYKDEQEVENCRLVVIEGAPHPCYLDNVALFHLELGEFLMGLL